MHEARRRRDAVLDALIAVDTRNAFAALALNVTLTRRRLDGAGRAYATEVVYGTLRWRGTIDWMISQCSRRPPDDLDPVVRNILRMAVYEIRFMRTVPGPIACHEAVALAKRRRQHGAAGFVNAVCRAILHTEETNGWPWPSLEADPAAALAVLTSHPPWLVARWIDRFGVDEARALCEANNMTPPLHVRTNTRQLQRDELAAALRADGADVAFGSLAPEALHVRGLGRPGDNAAFRAGAFTVQDEGAQLVAPALSPLPGQRIIDLCAAPGGKTTHIAELMRDQGELIAVDVHENKLGLVRDNARRLRLGIIEIVPGDGRTMPGRLAPADGVLLDAPCSGLGVLRRRPDLRWRPREAALRPLAEQQGELLKAAAALTRPGGIIVYSTCSIEPEETTAVVEAFLANDARFEPEPPPKACVVASVGGYLFPHQHATDGFFIARLRRAS